MAMQLTTIGITWPAGKNLDQIDLRAFASGPYCSDVRVLAEWRDAPTGQQALIEARAFLERVERWVGEQ